MIREASGENAAELVEVHLSHGNHPGGDPGINLRSVSHRCYLVEVTFVSELTKETIVLPLGFLRGGLTYTTASRQGEKWDHWRAKRDPTA